jgi:hypothetical protein
VRRSEGSGGRLAVGCPRLAAWPRQRRGGVPAQAVVGCATRDGGAARLVWRGRRRRCGGSEQRQRGRRDEVQRRQDERDDDDERNARRSHGAGRCSRHVSPRTERKPRSAASATAAASSFRENRDEREFDARTRTERAQRSIHRASDPATKSREGISTARASEQALDDGAALDGHCGLTTTRNSSSSRSQCMRSTSKASGLAASTPSLARLRRRARCASSCVATRWPSMDSTRSPV